MSAGWGNNEQQYYADSAHNAVVMKLDGLGVLQVTAYCESINGVQPYSSAKLITEGLHAFSPTSDAVLGIRVEARAKMQQVTLGIVPCCVQLSCCNNGPVTTVAFSLQHEF